jgi:signal peptide peptidase SppA
MSMFFGGDDASTLRAAQQIRWAANNPDVKDITIAIESGGGEVAGAFDLAQVVRAAAKKKDVIAHISDIGASAAYLVASQATTVYANVNAAVGSIGVYTTIADTSKAYADRGVKMYLVKAGEFKGIGTNGIEVSEADLATIQKRVDSFHALFTQYVAKGRSLDEAAMKKISDAQVFIGKEAIGVKLVDKIVSFEDALRLHRRSATQFSVGDKGNKNMSGTAGSANDAANDPAASEATDPLLEHVIDGGLAEDVVEDVAASDATTEATQHLVDTSADTPVATDSIDWNAVGTALGVTGGKDRIATLIKNGGDFENRMRLTAKKYAVMAGVTDQDALIDSMTIASLESYIISTSKLAKALGLMNNARATEAGRAVQATGGTQVVGEQQPDSAQLVDNTVRVMRAHGSFI